MVTKAGSAPAPVDELEQRVREWIRSKRIEATPDDRIRASVAAELIMVNPRTLRRWEEQGIGPRVTTIGRRRFYRLADLVAWLRNGDSI